MENKLVIPAETNSVGECLDFIERSLKEHKLNRREISEAVLLSEESIIQLLDNSDGGDLHIKVKKIFGATKIVISATGKEFSFSPNSYGIDFSEIEEKRESEVTIRGMLMNCYTNKLKCTHKGKYNFAEIIAGTPERSITLFTIAVFLISLAIGLFMELIFPASALKVIDSYVLVPIETIFINALKLTVAPIVFFSILTSFAKYSSLTGSGRINFKIILIYLLTSAVSVCVGFWSYSLVLPGVSGEFANFVEHYGISGTAGVQTASDFVNTVVDIVPDNFVAPFLNINTLQLIFLALICGVALGRAGAYSNTLQSAAQAMETLCSSFSKMLGDVVPIAVSFSTVSLVFNADAHILLSLGKMVLTLLLALVIMLAAYLLLILLVRLNPLKFIKKYYPTMKQTFFTGSSADVIPKIIVCCKRKLGISQKVYSFSIPFGAMANMDGNCIYLTIVSLFMARICGVELLGGNLITLILSVVILSIGAPMASGSVLLAMLGLLSQFDISLTSICLLLGINSLIEMVLTVFDTMGDVVVSLVVAKTEKLLNKEIYYS